MDNFHQRLQDLKREARAQKDETQQQAETAELLAAFRARQAEQRREDLTQQRRAILLQILDHLNCRQALLALRAAGIARGFRGPVVQPGVDRRCVKLVLTRTRWQWFPFRRFVDQIGVRAYDAGQVMIQVAEFRRSGRVWKVIPLSEPLPFMPEDRVSVENAIMQALLAWAEKHLG